MKDLLSKEHYFYVIHNLYINEKQYLPLHLHRQSPVWTTLPPLPHFYKKILISTFCDFSKIPTPLKKGSSHYVKGIFNIIRNGYTFLHKGGEWILYFFVVSVKFLFILSLFYARWLVDLFCSEQLAMFFFTELAIYECIWNSLTCYCLMIKVR